MLCSASPTSVPAVALSSLLRALVPSPGVLTSCYDRTALHPGTFSVSCSKESASRTIELRLGLDKRKTLLSAVLAGLQFR